MKTTYERLKGKYRVDTQGCWIWTGAVGGSRSKRPQIRINWKLYYVSRVTWELYKGPIPPGLYVCHTCDVELCVNPEHMFLGTQKENMRDASRKKRFSGRQSLNEAKVTLIRTLRSYNLTHSAIAYETGLPIGTIGAVLIGTRWGA